MKEIDVLYIHPNGSGIIYQELSNKYSAIEPPIWAALLAKNSINHGHQTKILDCEAERFDTERSANAAVALSPRLYAIVVYGQQPSASTQNMVGASALIKSIKEKDANSKILLLGLHPSAVSRKTILEEQCDFVCQGEGPYTINRLLQIDMNSLDDLKTVPGLWYRVGGDICFTKPAPIISQDDLETVLPGMAWELLPMDKYRTSNWHAMTNNNEKQPFASLYTSLGCPFSCSFCCINAPFGNNNLENWDYGRNKFRFWKPEFIIEQFDMLHKMGIKNIKIADEMFVFNKNHFLRLCELIIDRKYDFNIWAYARIDTVKEEYLETLKKAGVNWLALGIESGNKDVRKDVIKGKFTELNIKDLIKKIQDHGINVIGNYIFGLPEDNVDTMQETLQMALDLNCEFSNFYCTMAYPGSQLYIEALKNKWTLPENYVGYSQHSYEARPLDTKYISAKEVLKFRDSAFQIYYSDKMYLDSVERKFGLETREDIEEMTKIKLKRQLLGD
jgi:anaerobic magnesium-protoporphyrin IX monomethyl ester cyclase